MNQEYQWMLQIPSCKSKNYCEYRGSPISLNFEGQPVKIVPCEYLLKDSSPKKIVSQLPVLGLERIIH